MTRSGTAFRLPPLAPRTSVIGYGSSPWPTPSATNGLNGGSNSRRIFAKRWPTPSAAVRNLNEEPEEWLARAEQLREKWGNGNGAGTPLEIAVKLWPTPAHADGERKSETYVRGNPTLLGAARMWPTPRASENENRQTKPTPSQLRGEHGMNLATAVNLWPTPTVTGNHNRRGAGPKSGDGLATAVGFFPTPTANRWDGLQSHGVNVVKGSLNPDWVDILMGFPQGWSATGGPPLRGRSTSGSRQESPAASRSSDSASRPTETRSCRKSSSGSAAASLPSMRGG